MKMMQKLKDISAAQIARVRSSFALIENISAETPLQEVLQALARVPIRTLLDLLSLIGDANAFVSQVEAKLSAQIKTLEDADPGPVADSILILLTQLREAADVISTKPA